jgi:hypothetical protein
MGNGELWEIPASASPQPEVAGEAEGGNNLHTAHSNLYTTYTYQVSYNKYDIIHRSMIYFIYFKS